MARKLAAAHGLGADDVIVDRTALDDLQSALYCLQAAVEDVDRDLDRQAERDRGARGARVAARQRPAARRDVDRAEDDRRGPAAARMTACPVHPDFRHVTVFAWRGRAERARVGARDVDPV